MKAQEARDLAAQYAAVGIPVFPIGIKQEVDGSLSKTPLNKNGFKGATTDPDEIDTMFKRSRLRTGQWWGVGAVPGLAGYIVIDVDVKNGAPGLEDIKRLTDELGTLDGAMRVETASGGYHLWLKRPADGELTLFDQILVSDGLLQGSGLTLVPGSTQIARPDFMRHPDGTPKRTLLSRDQAKIDRDAYSDHFPVVARFRLP